MALAPLWPGRLLRIHRFSCLNLLFRFGVVTPSVWRSRALILTPRPWHCDMRLSGNVRVSRPTWSALLTGPAASQHFGDSGPASRVRTGVADGLKSLRFLLLSQASLEIGSRILALEENRPGLPWAPDLAAQYLHGVAPVGFLANQTPREFIEGALRGTWRAVT